MTENIASIQHDRLMSALFRIRRELEAEESWPNISVDAALLLYDVARMTGLSVGDTISALGPAAWQHALEALEKRWRANDGRIDI